MSVLGCVGWRLVTFEWSGHIARAIMCRTDFLSAGMSDGSREAFDEDLLCGFVGCFFRRVLRGPVFSVVCADKAGPHRCDAGGFCGESLRQLLPVCVRQAERGES